MNSTNRFTLDMHSVQSQISIPVSLYDTARTLYISFMDGGNPFVISKGCLAKLAVALPSGDTVHEFCNIAGNTTAVFPFSQNARVASEEGLCNCELTLYSLDGEKLTSPRFTLVVSDRVYPVDDNGGITEDDHGVLDAIIINEQGRRASEFDRETAETERATAENVRVEAEASRDTAEAERVTADETRKAEYTKLERDVSETVRKILNLQGRVIEIQNELINIGDIQGELATIIKKQNGYLGGE